MGRGKALEALVSDCDSQLEGVVLDSVITNPQH